MRVLTTLFRLIVLAAGIAAISCRSLPEESSPPPVSTSPDPAAPTGKIVAPHVPGSFADTIRRVKPSVVNIFTAQIVRERPRRGYSLFEDLFGGHHRERIQRSLGSGFIIDRTGYVLTNYHVIRGAQEILVQLADDREIPAIPVGIEPGIDAALLRIEADDLVPLPMGDSNTLEVGEWILAIGNPFGLSSTVTAGIVSAKGRNWHDIGGGLAASGYQNFIQTDASINPGNSGGPMVNLAGEVVGMNTAISAEGQGIGFAVPINMLKTVLPQLKQTGRVVPAWLGVGIRDLNIPLTGGGKGGVLVTEVFASGPAHTAGILPGDIIERINGNIVRDSAMMSWITATAGIGNNVTLDIVRGDRPLQIKVEVQARPR